MNLHGDCGENTFAEESEAVKEFAINTRHLGKSGANKISEKQCCIHPGNYSGVMFISIGIVQGWHFRGLVTNKKEKKKNTQTKVLPPNALSCSNLQLPFNE